MPVRQTHSQQRAKTQLIMGGIVFLALAGAAIVGASQLQVFRDLFSQASGTPANLVVDTTAVIGPMPRPWRNLAQGGEDHNWRMTPIEQQVKAIKPEYIRLDHIYDFYDIVQGTPGNLTFNFTKFDLIIDDILAAGAKPYIALSYMPPAISSGDILAKPQNWNDWSLVVQKTIEHVSGTRGISDVYYEVWNEPDLFGNWKYYGDKNYLDLYTYAAKGAERAKGVRNYKFGGPAITALYKNWFDAMAKHALANNLRYDFFSWHRYSNNLNQYPKDMSDAKTWLAEFPQLEPTLQLHLTEWGHDSNNHAGYDTNFAGAHTVAGSITMLNIIERAFIFEIQDGKSPENKELWGRWGMFTHSEFGSKPKPRYRAVQMLDKVSDQRLQITGQGSWVKALAAKNRANNSSEVVLTNYDPDGRNSEQVPITFTNIEPGVYTIRTERLGGQRKEEQTATDSAALKVMVPMPANDVVFVELIKQL